MILQVLRKYESLETVISVSSDGPNVNTGAFNGAIRNLEVAVNKPLQWLVCLLHLNELVFRHIFEHVGEFFHRFLRVSNVDENLCVDGESTGPTTYGGPIGVLISPKGGLVRTEINREFERVPGKVEWGLDDTILHNNDVRMLYHLCILLQEGPNTRNLELMAFFARKVGVVTTARWVTTASNLLCLYMQEKEPTPNLRLLVGKHVTKV